MGVLLIVLAGCSLDLTGGDDGDDGDDEATPIVDARVTPAPCELGPRYRMPHTDCGPLPPDTPPPVCYWTIDLAADAIVYCYTDVCESLSYECDGRTVWAYASTNRRFNGRILDDGNLYWDDQGGGEDGTYAPY